MPERVSREVRVFHELARVVAEEPFDVVRILERVCAELRDSFGFSRAIFARLNAEERTVHADVLQGLDWPGDQWLMLDRFPFLVRAMETQEASFVRDAREEQAMPAKIAALFDVRSIVAVPLQAGGTCLGFLIGDRAGAGFELERHDLELLTAIGRVTAVFVAKADDYGELARSIEQLRAVDSMKTDFISIASHELRTPIAVVHGITSTLHLRGNQLRPEQLVELRATLFEQTTRLSALTDQLLDLSRLESGTLLVTPERFHPRERLDTLLPRLVPDRLPDISVEVDPGLELVTDPSGVERVLSNLVLNALTYGRPPVCIRLERNGRVHLIVEDCGDGVDPDFAALLFDRFSRGETSRRRATNGAGLGLAIARSYAQALGGDLEYEPAAPGSRFTLSLPPETLVA